MKHPNTLMLEKMYSEFSKGDITAFLNHCADNITFQIAGKSKLAGKYTKETFAAGISEKLTQISNGTFKLEVHDILANDQHGIALASDSAVIKGEKVQYLIVHVWRFENLKPVAWYEYPRDMYQFDSIWS